MRDYSGYFENEFDSRIYSRENWMRFLEDYILRLKKEIVNGEPLQQYLHEIEDLYNQATNSSGKTAFDRSVQKSSTLNVDLVIEEFKALVSKREGRIRDAFGKGTPEYTIFFPNGVSEYSNMTKKTIENLFQRFYDAAEQFKVELGPVLVDEITTLHNKYLDLRSTQVGKKQDVASAVNNFETTLIKIKDVLHIQRLQLAILYYRNPPKALSLFNQSLIENNRKSKTKEEQDNTYTVTIPANATKEAGFAFSVDKTMLFSNVGSEAVLVYGAATVDAPLSPTAIELLSGEEKEITATQLGAPANRFILMMNKSVAAEAEVEILFV
jgi:hypothetical protein